MEPIGILKDGQIYDLQTAEALNIQGDEIKADDSKESLDILRHSCAHLMAQAIKELYPEAKFFVGPVVKEGFYYITKGDDNNKIIPIVSRAMDHVNRSLALSEGNDAKTKVNNKIAAPNSFDTIIGNSILIKQAEELAKKVSATDVPVLLTGETGTGKEVFAQAIHNSSSRHSNSNGNKLLCI